MKNNTGFIFSGEYRTNESEIHQRVAGMLVKPILLVDVHPNEI